MQKKEIVCTVAKEAGLTLAKAEQVVSVILDEVKASLSRGETVTLRHFGIFDVRAKLARKGRNPKTGQPAEIAARRVVRFKPGRNFRAAVNGETDAASR